MYVTLIFKHEIVIDFQTGILILYRCSNFAVQLQIKWRSGKVENGSRELSNNIAEIQVDPRGPQCDST